MIARPSPDAGRRRTLLWLGVAVAVIAAAAASRALPRGGSAATGTAEWIWLDASPRTVGPRTFFTARDFELAERPPSAVLSIQADDEYVLYLNGRSVGAGARRPGAPFDAYEVGGLLAAGANRIAVTLASGRGSGGLLLRLTSGAGGRELVVSDGRWRTFERFEPGLVEGWLPLAGGEPALSWGRPPVGRLPAPPPGEARPVGPLPRPVEAGAAGRVAGPPGLASGDDRGWTLWDLGREVDGRLVVERQEPRGEDRPRLARKAAIVFLGAAGPADLADWPPDLTGKRAAVGFAFAPEQRVWTSGRVRHQRWAVVIGSVAIRSVAVVPEAGPPAAPYGGAEILGLEPPRRATPAEREVARDLREEAAAVPP